MSVGPARRFHEECGSRIQRTSSRSTPKAHTQNRSLDCEHLDPRPRAPENVAKKEGNHRHTHDTKMGQLAWSRKKLVCQTSRKDPRAGGCASQPKGDASSASAAHAKTQPAGRPSAHKGGKTQEKQKGMQRRGWWRGKEASEQARRGAKGASQ